MKHRKASVALVAFTLVATPAPLFGQGGDDGGGAALFSVNVGLTIWTIVVFVLLAALLKKFAWGNILEQAQAREDRIQGSLDEAARRQAEASALLEQHRAQLQDARRQAQEIVAEGKAAGERVRADIEERARAEGQAMVERARAEIEREKDAALDEIRKESVDLAMAVAARLMQEKLDPERDRRLVVGYLDELGRQPANGGRHA